MIFFVAVLAAGVGAGLAQPRGAEQRPGVSGGDHPDARLYFPPAKGEWKKVDAASLGWDAKKLEAAFDFAKQERSTGLVILHQGRLVAERYWTVEVTGDSVRLIVKTLPDGRTVEDVASMQKSVVAFMTAMARDRGLLDYDQPVSTYLGKGWCKATPEQEAAITVRHLLTMSSGLKESLEYEAAAGTKFLYNSPAYFLLRLILTKVTGKELQPLTAEWLLSPVGMTETQWIDRAKEINRRNHVGLCGTARDMARFGLLCQAEGVWDGQPVLKDAKLLREMLSPSPQKKDYGQLWWLSEVPPAPRDLFFAMGHGTRRIYVVPSLRLVVVRLGDTSASRTFDRELWRLLMASVHKEPF
ncbi:MAG: beta-lactamase family protein [Verrucomicrobiales bacterium]|nr:beta-lactamase family protein [Verrucomicrobiales bacterium]